MRDSDEKRLWSFKRIFALAVGAALIFAVIYMVFVGEFSWWKFSDGLCTSALGLALLAALPLLLELGRGTVAFTKIKNQTEAQSTMEREHQLRERGMVVTFAIAAAVVCVATLALIAGAL